MHLITAALVFFALLELSSAQCLFLLNDYYTCRYLDFKFTETHKNSLEMYSGRKNTKETSYSTNVPWNHTIIKFDGKLKDQFFSDILAVKNSSQAPMDLFRRLYIELNNCTSEFCRCSKNRAFQFNKYKDFLLNEKYYSYTKELFGNVSSTFRQRSLQEIMSDASSTTMTVGAQPQFDNFAPSLVNYCIRYEFSSLMVGYFKETLDCANKMYEKPNDLKKCFDDNLGDAMEFQKNPKSKTNAQLEGFTRCVFALIKCPPLAKNVFKFHFVSQFPHIILGDIKKYMQNL